MKAAVFEAFGEPLTIQQVADPSLPRDGVVLRVEATGICRSDWHGWMGHDPDVRLPHVPGHELVGIVEEAGPEVQRWRRGDRVTVPFAIGCGRCPQCLTGNQHICDDYYQPGFTGWGSFAQWVALPHADVNLVGLPDEIESVAAASLGCRFITSFRAIVAQGRAVAGEWVVVHGCGGVGLAAIMIANALGARVIGVDLKREALELARTLGADHALHAGEPNLIQAVRDLTGGGAHLSVDALGSHVTCRNSILSLRKRGRHVQVGLMLADQSDPPLPMDRVIAWELELLGSHGMQAHAYPAILGMILAGKLDPGRLIRSRIPLEGASDALAAMGSFGATGVTVIDRL